MNGLLAAAFLLFTVAVSAQSLTWDATTGNGTIENGSGIWNTVNTNWWNGSANTSWVNSTTAIAQFGTPTPVSANTISITEDIVLKELRFLPVTTGTIVSGQQYTLNGDVAGRILDFGANGLIQMDDRSSGGSQFASLGANLRLKGSNLRIQKLSGTNFQYLTLGMATNPDLTGNLTIGGSIYAAIAAPGTLQNITRLVVEAGGSAPLGGTNPNYTVPISIAGYGNSLLFTSTSYGALRITSNNTTISGGITLTADAGIHNNFSLANGTTGTVISAPIVDGGSNFSFSHFSFTRGDGTFTFAAANTYGGATILGRALAGYAGGVNILDFTAGTSPQNDILYNGLAAPGRLDLIGGNSVTVLRLTGKSGQTDSQRLGNVTVNGTHSSLELISGAGGTVNVSLGSFSRTDNAATLAISGPASGSISTTQAAGFVGPWMTYADANGSRSWAQVAGGVIGNRFAGTALYTTGASLSTAPFVSGSNLSITGTSSGNLVMGAGVTALNTLSMADLSADRTVQAGSGQTLRLGTQAGIQILSSAKNLTVGDSAGTLTAGGPNTNTAGQLFLSNESTAAQLTLNANITNNGTGIVTLVSNGAAGSRTVLSGTNTYTGGTQISSGILEVRSNGALGTTGTVTVVDGATLALSGGITISRALAAVGGFGDGNNGAIRSVSGNNIITGAITQNAMFMIAADAGASLTIQPSSTITSSSVITFGGAGTVTVNAALIGAAALSKIGTGLLVLAGNSTYTGGTTISSGTMRLGSATALGATSAITISPGATVDLNGFTTGGIFNSINGTGVGSGGAIINSSATTATITGLSALSTASNIGGSGNITVSNATGLTGNVLLTKSGGGTLTFIDSTTTSARTGVTQIDAGTLRVQSTLAIAPVGTGAYALNGGTLSLGFDAANTMTNAVNVISNSTIVADRASAAAGGISHTLGLLAIGGSTLTVKPGDNVTSSTMGLTLGTATIGGASMAPGNPTFDVQSTAAAAMTLTLGAFSDQAIAPRTITFQNSGTAASTVTLATAAASLVDGTVVNIANTGGALTLNLNNATALGALAQVTVASGNTLSVGAASTLGSLAGTGTVSASGAFALTVGNALNNTAQDSTFSGVLSNGSGTLTLTKGGKSTLTLDGSVSNTYTGLTTVNNGTLALGKTGGAIAVGGSLTIGAAAAGTVGNATVKLNASEQVISSGLLVMNAGSTLNLNGFTQTFGSISSLFGATISGGGTLALANSSGTNTYGGVDTFSSNFQLTTSTAATRTVAVTSVTDQLTISGNISEGAAAGSISKTLVGTLVLSGNNSYTSTTTVAAGILNIRSANALGTVGGITSVTSGATLQIQGGITTAAEPLTLAGGSGFVGANGIGTQTGALVNVSGVNNYAGLVTLSTAAVTIASDSGTLNLTHAGTITGAFGLVLAGAGDGSISSIIGTAAGTVTKNGTGTWTLKGVNTSTGAITINAGTLKLGDGTTGRWSSAPALTYTGSGTFEFGGSTAASTQALGALTLTSGGGTLQVDAPASGTNAVTFTSLVAPAAGSGLNLVSPANTSVTITGAANTNGIVNAHLNYNGADFAASTAGVIGASGTTTATSSLAGGNTTPYLISGSFTQTGSITASAGLKFTGSDKLTISNGVLLTINNGTNTAGGLLVAGGVAAVIANEGTATGITTGGSGDLVVRTNAATDSLDIQVPITSTTAGGLTKNGAGTLSLSAANAYTGSTFVNAGTLVLGNAAAMSTSAATVLVGGVLDLNGKVITNTATLNGAGISNGGALINSSGTAAFIGALTIGAGNGSGGIGASIGGTGNITSTGALVGNNLLVKVGSGTVTFGDNAGTALASARTVATRIDAGTVRISNSTSALGAATAPVILNGGTLSLGSTASVVAYPTSVTASSAIVSDVYTGGAGLTHALGVLAIGAQTLTISAGSNVTSAGTNAGVTFAATTLLGNATFDVQSPTTATGGTTTLILGALSDQGVAKTITFANTGTATMNSLVTLATAMASLVDGTVVNINSGTNAGVTLNLNLAAALGTLAQVTVNGNSTLNIGAAQTLGSLSGTGTVSAAGSFTLTVGSIASSSPLSTNFTGTLSNGAGTLALTKNGLGTLTLTPSAATYSGATIVSAGILKLGNASALGSTSGVTISAGGTMDLNGQSTDRNFISISGTGHNGGGALINNSTTTSTITGTTVLGAVAKMGGSGNITFNNVGGLTGSSLLTKIGTGTLTSISSTSSTRSGTNQIDAGTLRVQSSLAVVPLGVGNYAMNGGTLSLGFDVSNPMINVVNVLNSSTMVVDRASAGAGGISHNLGALNIAGSTLTVKAGDNVTSGTIGLTWGTTSIGNASLAPGNPTFDVQSTASATMSLTLGGLTDQAIAPRTITFQNSGTAASIVTLPTAAVSLVDGTVVNMASTGGTLTLNLNIASALGTFAQVTVGSGNTLSLGASQTVSALNGSGAVTASAASVITIGNILSPNVSNSVFNGVLAGGANLSYVKAGQGSLTLGGADSNTFAGTNGFVVNGGTVILAKTGGAVAVPTSLTIDATGTAVGTAAVRLGGNDQVATSASLIMSTGSTFDLNGFNQGVGKLNGTDGGTILNNATGTASTLTIGGGDTTGGVFLGNITDHSTGTGTVALVKTGTGLMALGGSSSYTGTTLVQGGSLQVGIGGIGQSGGGATTLSNGSVLLGSGVVQGSSFTAASGSIVYAGDGIDQASYGTLNFTPVSGSGTFDFQSGSTVVLGITATGNSDLLNFTGTGINTLLFNGDLTVSAPSFTPVSEKVFNLLDWTGLALPPAFASRYNYTGTLYGNGDEAAGLDLPDIAGSGYGWDISNLSINGSIALIGVAPEPSRVLLLLLSAGLLMTRRRR